ncbi:ribonuclease H-like domain-containing protein, partial [Tanacetum coccineum]
WYSAMHLIGWFWRHLVSKFRRNPGPLSLIVGVHIGSCAIVEFILPSGGSVSLSVFLFVIMVKGDMPLKKKDQASGSDRGDTDQFDPLFLHSNDTNGQVFSKNAKVVWDELVETYSKQDASGIFNMHYKIHSLSQSGSAVSEYYHKFNALWRQYDSLVNLPDYICENSEKLKEHN